MDQSILYQLVRIMDKLEMELDMLNIFFATPFHRTLKSKLLVLKRFSNIRITTDDTGYSIIYLDIIDQEENPIVVKPRVRNIPQDIIIAINTKAYIEDKFLLLLEYL